MVMFNRRCLEQTISTQLHLFEGHYLSRIFKIEGKLFTNSIKIPCKSIVTHLISAIILRIIIFPKANYYWCHIP